MTRRGGDQHIPRPPTARHGRPAPWTHLPAAARRFTLDDIRTACRSLEPPSRHALRVPGVRAAAVLMPFFERGGEALVVLTKRPEHMPSHKGEIAFPGGRRCEADSSFVETALRETEEELGLAREVVEVVGELPPYATLSSRFAIVPFVGVISGPVTYRPDPNEVAKVLEVPVSELLADGVHREERWGTGTADRPVHFFELEGETVWGATAGMLFSFLERLVGRS